MKGKTNLEILKNAILLERQGKAFYESVASSSTSGSVKNIFSIMAGEEEKHIGYLSVQYRSIMKNGYFVTENYYDNPENISKRVLTEEIKKEINAASYEGAAISAAIEMEKKAVDLYSGRAKATKDKHEQKLYETLANWEKTHLDFLAALNEELTEEIWFENSFWPY